MSTRKALPSDERRTVRRGPSTVFSVKWHLRTNASCWTFAGPMPLYLANITTIGRTSHFWLLLAVPRGSCTGSLGNADNLQLNDEYPWGWYGLDRSNEEQVMSGLINILGGFKKRCNTLTSTLKWLEEEKIFVKFPREWKGICQAEQIRRHWALFHIFILKSRHHNHTYTQLD